MADNIQFESLGGQIMPFSAEAEQSVLGSVLIDPSSLDTVCSMLKPEHFYLPQHQAIFTAMVDMYAQSKPVDPVTLLEELKQRGVYDESGGKSYLMQLAQVVPVASNVAVYAKTVYDKFISRSLIEASRKTISDVEEGAGDAGTLVDLAEQRIFEIRQGREVDGLKHIKDVLLGETIDRLNKMSDPDIKAQFTGIPTGIADLDRVITGLNKPDLIVLGARPGMGKTSFALNIARHVAVKEKRTVAFFSLEMTRDQIAMRLLSADAYIDSKKLRTGELEGAEWTRLVQAVDVLSASEFYIDETSNITVPEMRAKLRRMRHVDLVIIDYLGLMHSPKHTDNRVLEISEITRGLKIMAKDLNVPIIVCAQLSRASEGQDKRSHKPVLSNLRDSGSIEQDADIVMFLYRENYYSKDNNDPENQADSHEAICIVAKNRHGEVCDVPLYWDDKHTRYTGVSRGTHEA
ncbi:MAG: replicative DNA helicase [Firmicutes bacterium]|nr:replicative DNA helicase [Bacillota bacterium]